jgi:hypothetical protein
LAKDQWFPVNGNVPIVAQVSLNCLSNQMVQSQSTVAIVIAKIKNQELLWAVPAETLVKEQWFPVIGNVEIVVPQSLNCLSNQMVPSQFTAAIAIAIVDLHDQVDTNKKMPQVKTRGIFY